MTKKKQTEEMLGIGISNPQSQASQADITTAIAVPSADSTANTDGFDVIGNKTDTVLGDSLYSATTRMGGRLGIKSITLSASATYTPAFLTGDTGAESVAATWAALTNTGKFKITIDGQARSVNPDFTGDASMADVAASIQAAIRVATGALETCTWEGGNHFLISSVNTTSASAITVTSAPDDGVDISGAGAADWMDCDALNGVVTNKVVVPATASVNLFSITGSVNVYKLHAIVTAAGTLANLTAGSFNLYDGTNTVQLTKNDGVLSGVSVGTTIAKIAVNSVTWGINNSDQVRHLENSTAGEAVYHPFLATQKVGTNTYLRFTYTTTDSPIAASITVYAEYAGIGAGILTAV